MYYNFTMIYKNRKVSCPTVENQEYSDQVAYCREGIRSGFLLSYSYETVIESW